MGRCVRQDLQKERRWRLADRFNRLRSKAPAPPRRRDMCAASKGSGNIAGHATAQQGRSLETKTKPESWVKPRYQNNRGT